MLLFQSINRYGENVNSYDIVKFLALILMVIDHIGAYFFPNIQELRMIGRMSAPIWLILVGYSDARNIPISFIIGAIIIVVSGLIAGGPVTPLNILFSVFIIRAVIDKITNIYFKDYSSLFSLFVILALLTLPINAFFDYGACAILFAVYGFMLRHKNFKINSSKIRMLFATALVAFYSIYQGFMFQFNEIQTIFVFFTVGAVVLMMSVFKPYDFVGFSKKSPKFITNIIRICGRYNLEFYVLHLSAFKILSTLLQTGKTNWFEFQLFPFN